MDDLDPSLKETLLNEKPGLDIWNADHTDWPGKHENDFHDVLNLNRWAKDKGLGERFKPEHISQVLSNPDEDPDVRLAAIKHPLATAEHVSQVLNNPNEHWSVRLAAIEHPLATAEHVSQVLNNPKERPSVRLAAIQHKNATAEHISQVLNNPNEHPEFRKAAIKHKNATAEHISQALNNPNEHPEFRKAAIQHPNSTAEHISQVLNNPKEYWTVRQAAIQHPLATAEHVSQILNNPNEDWAAKRIAQAVSHKRFPHLLKVSKSELNKMSGPVINPPNNLGTKDGPEHPMYGWISPEGKFNHVTSKSGGHHEFIRQKMGISPSDNPAEEEAAWKLAHDKGWIAVGRGADMGVGMGAIAGNKEVLSNKRHPAAIKLRSMMRQHWTESSMDLGDMSADAEHYIKHGSIKPILDKSEPANHNPAEKLARSKGPLTKTVRSPRKGHTIAQLERLKQDNWRNPDTGTEISEGEGEEHLNQMRQNQADKAVARWVKEQDKPKTKGSANPEDVFGVEKGQKLEHFSPQAGLKEIDPRFKGKGVDGRARRESEHPHSFYYIAGTEPEDVVTQVARSKYTVELPDDAKIYDLATDPEGVISKLHKLSLESQVNTGIVQMNDVHHALKSLGYHGFTNSKHETLPNVVALYHSAPVAHEEPLRSSEALDFFCKSEKNLAATGLALLYPVSINGKTHREGGTPYHATVKFFDKEGVLPEHAHSFATKEHLEVPDSKNISVVPKVFKNRFGDDVYVLSLHGAGVEHVKGINEKAKDMGLPTAYVFQPHISVDKETFDHASSLKNPTAESLGIKFGNAELRHGPKILATYPDRKDHGLKAIYRKYKI